MIIESEINLQRKTKDELIFFILQLQDLLKKKDKIINEIQKEVNPHIGFEKRLKRENQEPDLFNQGKFFVANNIEDILKGRGEND